MRKKFTKDIIEENSNLNGRLTRPPEALNSIQLNILCETLLGGLGSILNVLILTSNLKSSNDTLHL